MARALGSVVRLNPRRSGLGDGYDPLTDPNYIPGIIGPGYDPGAGSPAPPSWYPAPTGGGGSQPSGGGVIQSQIPALIAAGLKTISNLFAPVPVSVAQAEAAQYANQYSLYGNQQRYPTTYPQGAHATGGVGIGVDGNGIRLSDGSHIGWLPIGGLILGIFLLQSRGLTRRNPLRRISNPKTKKRSKAKRR